MADYSFTEKQSVCSSYKPHAICTNNADDSMVQSAQTKE